MKQYVDEPTMSHAADSTSALRAVLEKALNGVSCGWTSKADVECKENPITFVGKEE